MVTSDLKESEVIALVKKDKVQGLSSGELKRLKKAWNAYVYFRKQARKAFRKVKFYFTFYSKAELPENEKSYAYITVAVPCCVCDIGKVEDKVIAQAKKHGLYKAGITASGAGYGFGERDVSFLQH